MGVKDWFQGREQGPQPAQAEHRDPEGDFTLPATLASWTAPEPIHHHGHGGGVSRGYHNSYGFEATVFVYTAGVQSIADGARSREVRSHFDATCVDILNKWEVVAPFDPPMGSYRTLTNGWEWLYTRCELIMNGVHQTSWLYLTGWSARFVKVRHTYLLEFDDVAHGPITHLVQGLTTLMTDQRRG